MLALVAITALALRDQIVTGVASFNSDLITQTAQFGDFVEQDNCITPFLYKVELVLSAGPILTCWQIGVRQQSQVTSTLDGACQLTLILGAGTGDTVGTILPDSVT